MFDTRCLLAHRGLDLRVSAVFVLPTQISGHHHWGNSSFVAVWYIGLLLALISLLDYAAVVRTLSTRGDFFGREACMTNGSSFHFCAAFLSINIDTHVILCFAYSRAALLPHLPISLLWYIYRWKYTQYGTIWPFYFPTPCDAWFSTDPRKIAGFQGSIRRKILGTQATLPPPRDPRDPNFRFLFRN